MSNLYRNLVEMPIVTKVWSKYPKIWKHLVNVGLFIKYKTIHFEKLPSSIKLPSSFDLHINPEENRGRALLIRNGLIQEGLARFWVSSVHSFSPTIVLDVGVNYGEYLFTVKYPKSTKIYGIEANEQLLNYIDKSLENHPNKSQFNIIHAFATNREQQTHPFYIDKNWSGTSSGNAFNFEKVEKKVVPTITVDSLLKEANLKKERILFKIDVEGYEALVLEGMEHTIKNSKHLLGIIEFDSIYLQKAGTNLHLFLNKLDTNFYVYLFNKDGQLLKIDYLSLETLQKALKSKHIHTDLILSTTEL
ncbi:FkbM family methyltransferase [Bacillus luteolus]|uniref:FkbM family methyltransferase n=1 Tax=Litchfieldia luteola TaxID=682179 RepID=A0ABR9QGL2_9BACI|nr:FkbM family methyltransferase [Cytobacillus luteolus]MBE4907624.1 FkbM family methyltransferase [Cytobacillus luteolus]MBP1941075.1 FkbM family methyltransferase [Cytobacillus luteolus]